MRTRLKMQRLTPDCTNANRIGSPLPMIPKYESTNFTIVVVVEKRRLYVECMVLSDTTLAEYYVVLFPVLRHEEYVRWF